MGTQNTVDSAHHPCVATHAHLLTQDSLCTALGTSHRHNPATADARSAPAASLCPQDSQRLTMPTP
eukprot:5943053-Pleurochrysis_carterae.AAC.1